MTGDDSFEISKEQMQSLAGVLLLTLFVWAILSIAINGAVNQEIRVEGMETDLLAKRIIYSSECFAYSDEVRSYPGVVDLEKVSNDRLAACLGKKYFVRAIVGDKKAFNYNEDSFKEIRSFCSFKNLYYCNNFLYYVALKKDGKDVGGGFIEIGFAKQRE